MNKMANDTNNNLNYETQIEDTKKSMVYSNLDLYTDKQQLLLEKLEMKLSALKAIKTNGFKSEDAKVYLFEYPILNIKECSFRSACATLSGR